MMSKIIPVSTALLLLLGSAGSAVASEYTDSLSIGGNIKPGTPQELTAEKTGEQEITLNWEEVNGVDGYNLYRFVEQDGKMVEDRELDLGSTTYVDSNLDEGTYSYKAQSYSGDLVSDRSATTSEIVIVIEEDSSSDNGDTGDSSNDNNSSSSSGGSSGSSGGGGSSPADPPSIKNIEVDAGTSTAEITWETDEPSLTWIEYGVTTDYDSEIKTVSYNTSHSATLEDLSPDTTYYYHILAEDEDGDDSDYTSETFDTEDVDEGDDEEEGEVLGEKVVDERARQLNQILEDANNIFSGDISNMLEDIGKERDSQKEEQTIERYISPLAEGIQNTSQSNIDAMNDFVAYGTPSTLRLGAGERAGVVNSYKAAFEKLPTTEEEWQDVIKIANGRWPSERSKKAEDRAAEIFQEVYKRQPDMDNPHDNAAVTVMSYGLRPDNRNMESEAAAINSFEAIYDKAPESATDWDTVRAIAYSGATR